MALGLTQSLTQMSSRNLPGGEGRPARKADILTAICEPIVEEMWKPRCLTTLRASTNCYRNTFTFYVRVSIPTAGTQTKKEIKEQMENQQIETFLFGTPLL
jgi:hypothetical protein